MARNVSELFRDLEDEDFRVLNSVERGMEHNEWVPRTEIPKLARMAKEEVDYRIGRLNDFEMLERQTIQYEGYKLQSRGYDALALNALVKRDSVTAMGAKVEVGKESDIYKCKKDDEEVILKLHREGYTNFREVDKHRSYTSDKHHLSWMYTARKAAETEYENLQELYPDVSVPRPIDQSRHAIVMELFEGIELSRADIDEPTVVLDAVVREMKKAWDAGFVHSDMSEYNVLVSENEIKLIDWPQSVGTDHPHARELLDRDVSNILSYFERKYPHSKDEFPTHDEVVGQILG
ncbi:MAG: RIO1 family regulatory kinase/ATPase [Halobacteria archaeon]|nr:RIO1 family regulatory kinase/ATPase [Halobacteria archaeon]